MRQGQKHPQLMLLCAFIMSAFICNESFSQDAAASISPEVDSEIQAAVDIYTERANEAFRPAKEKCSNEERMKAFIQSARDAEAQLLDGAISTTAAAQVASQGSGANNRAGITQLVTGRGAAENARVAGLLDRDKTANCTCILKAEYIELPDAAALRQRAETECQLPITSIVARLRLTASSNAVMSQSAASAKSSLATVGAAGAGFLGGSLLSGKDKRETRENSAGGIDAAYANFKKNMDDKTSVVSVENGEKLNCISPENTYKSDCKPKLVEICTASDSQGSPLCMKFNDYHCASLSEAKNSVYCTKAAAHSYCKNSGKTDSPSCKWVSAPSVRDCEKDPEALQCRMAMTQEQLKSECNIFSDDPVCQLKDKIILTQPQSYLSQRMPAKLPSEDLLQSNSSVIQSMCSQLVGCVEQ